MPSEAHAALVGCWRFCVPRASLRAIGTVRPHAEELRSYDADMCDACGLAAGTRTVACALSSGCWWPRSRAGRSSSASFRPTTYGSSSPTISMPWAPPATPPRSRPPCGPTCAIARYPDMRRRGTAVVGRHRVSCPLEHGVVAARAQARGGGSADEFVHLCAVFTSPRLRRRPPGRMTSQSASTPSVASFATHSGAQASRMAAVRSKPKWTAATDLQRREAGGAREGLLASFAGEGCHRAPCGGVGAVQLMPASRGR